MVGFLVDLSRGVDFVAGRCDILSAREPIRAELPGMKNVLLECEPGVFSRMSNDSGVKAIGPNRRGKSALAILRRSYRFQTHGRQSRKSEATLTSLLGSHNGVSSLPIKHNSGGPRRVLSTGG